MTDVQLVSDAELAKRYLPHFRFDAAEPYFPYALGYSVFRGPGSSPSSKFEIEPAGAMTLEYAIFYDWDIGHLFDLEHVWVHVDDRGDVIRVEASAHGGRRVMDVGTGLPELAATHPVLYVEAGKHAHWAHPDHQTDADRRQLAALCGPLAGIEGVHRGNEFAKRGDYLVTARADRLARLKMQADAFHPTYDHQASAMEAMLLPWPDLSSLIPQRVAAAMTDLESSQPNFAAIFLDCGDTLINERTEVKLPGSEVVISAELIPGAREMLDALKELGHRLILVADGPRQTFVNMLKHHKIWDHFDAHIISEDIGAHKPDARMFDAALIAAGLTRDDAWRTVMVGNNLSRDIRGANALGISSVFMAWSTLRTHEPADATELAHYRIDRPDQLPDLLKRLEPLLRYDPRALHKPTSL